MIHTSVGANALDDEIYSAVSYTQAGRLALEILRATIWTSQDHQAIQSIAWRYVLSIHCDCDITLLDMVVPKVFLRPALKLRHIVIYDSSIMRRIIRYVCFLWFRTRYISSEPNDLN